MGEEPQPRSGDGTPDGLPGASPDGPRRPASQGDPPEWWHAYGDVVPSWFEPYLGLEQTAEAIRTYEVQFVPGLLQSPGYARAVIMLQHGHAPAEEVERRLELRTRRQEILRRTHPPELWAVIDEAALRRPIGGASVMSGQLQHLLELCGHPGVTVQLLPFQAAAHATAGGPITLLRMPEPDSPDVVYLEHLATAVYPDRSADLDFYRDVLNHIAHRAEPPAATPDLLRGIIRDL